MKFLDTLLESRVSDDTFVSLRKGETYQDRQRIDELLEEHWRDRRAWRRESSDQDKKFTYGEVTPMGVRQLIHLMELKGEAGEDEQRDPIIFYDLGSGAGKLVVQFFLEKVVTASIGVELSPARHALAVEAWENLQKSPDVLNQRNTYQSTDQKIEELPRVQFLNQDILDTDFSDATHLFISSLCFPDDLICKICEVILFNHHNFGKLQVVVALSDLDLLETEENRPDLKKSFELIQMTWGLSTVRVYKVIG